MQSIAGFRQMKGDRAERGNRMALYEQLTVSAHRFAKSSEACKPSSATPSGVEHSFLRPNQQPSSSLPLSFLPLSDKTRNFASPFFGTTEGTVICESKSDDSAKRQPIAASTTGQCLDYTTLKSSEELQASVPSNHSKKVKKEFASPVSGHDTSVVDVMLLVKGAQGLSIEDGLGSASASNEEALCPPAGCIGIGNVSKKGSLRDEMPLKPLEQDQNASNEEQEKDAECNFSSKHCSHLFRVGLTPQSHDEDIPLDGPAVVRVQDKCCSSERCMVTVEGNLDGIPLEQQEGDFSHCKINLAPAIPVQDTEILKWTQQSITCKAASEMNYSVVRDSVIGDIIKCNLAEASQDDIRMEDELNNSEVDCAFPIPPKAVIRTVGQLKFWKARLALIRQQRIFSDQVFELHKLIEVQRLLAGTPNVPINEMYFGVGSMITDCDHDGCSCDIAKKEKDTAEALGNQDFTSKEVGTAAALVGEENSELRNGQSNCPPNTAVKNGVSVWSYPNLGPPFAGDRTPGPAKGGPFTPAGSAGHRRASVGSPPFPYSFSAFSERPQCMASGPQASYGSVVASAHQQQSVVYGNQSSEYMVSNQSEMRTLNMNQCEHEGSISSVASINKEPVGSLHQMRPACSSMSSYLQRYEKEMESAEVENSQHASTGFELNMSRVRPPDDRDQHPKYINQVCTVAINMMQQDYAVERIVDFSKEARGFKRQKEREQLDWHNEMARGEGVLHGCTSSNLSMSALNLFPVAPTLALDDNGRRSLRGGKEWQGHVIKLVPRAANSAPPDLAAEILLSIQQEREP